uniref:Protein MIS12 homolog n=1 Tax=Caenorhabditis tropicalis TaxID=1561998 RepID=A0A1I7SYB5_9PELO
MDSYAFPTDADVEFDLDRPFPTIHYLALLKKLFSIVVGSDNERLKEVERLTKSIIEANKQSIKVAEKKKSSQLEHIKKRLAVVDQKTEKIFRALVEIAEENEEPLDEDVPTIEAFENTRDEMKNIHEETEKRTNEFLDVQKKFAALSVEETNALEAIRESHKSKMEELQNQIDEIKKALGH